MVFNNGEAEIFIDNFEVAGSFIKGYINSDIINGASYYISNNEGLYSTGATGYKTILSKEVASINTPYDIYDLTEIVVTTPLLCILENNGTISFDDKITKYIPNFYYPDITIRDLLEYKARLVTHLINHSKFDEKNFFDSLLHPTISKSKDSIDSTMTNFIILGIVIEKATNKTLDRLANELIFKPLGMRNTSFNSKDKTNNFNSSKRSAFFGHTGLFSTPIDLSHFTKMILNDGIVNGETFIPKKYIDSLFIPTKVGTTISSNMGWYIDPMQELFDSISGNFIYKTNYNNDIILIDKENGITIIILFDDDPIIDIEDMIKLVNATYLSMIESKTCKRRSFVVSYTN